jgi:hypothetical protein
MQNNLSAAVMQAVKMMALYNGYKPREKLYIINASHPNLKFSEVLLKPSQLQALT